jgi:hypothetical protein
MNTTPRRDLGFGLEPVTPLLTPPKSAEDIALRRRAAEAAAQTAGFPSREPQQEIRPQSSFQQKPDRRKRTGRDKSFACRTTTDHYDRFYKLNDSNKAWGGVGATFERAVEALEEKIRREGT